MLYAGLDLSRKHLDFHLLDADGATVEVGAAPPDADGLHRLTQRLDRVGCINSVTADCREILVSRRHQVRRVRRGPPAKRRLLKGHAVEARGGTNSAAYRSLCRKIE